MFSEDTLCKALADNVSFLVSSICYYITIGTQIVKVGWGEELFRLRNLWIIVMNSGLSVVVMMLSKYCSTTSFNLESMGSLYSFEPVIQSINSSTQFLQTWYVSINLQSAKGSYLAVQRRLCMTAALHRRQMSLFIAPTCFRI